METTVSSKPHAITWIAGIAITLFSAIGIAAIMGWLPTSMGSPPDAAVQSKVDSRERQSKAAQSTASRTPAAKSSEHWLAAGRPASATPRPAQIASAAPVAKAMCRECGVIVSMREVETEGEAGAVGAVGGAVVSGAIGNQVDHATGNKIARVAGAAGGAVAGHQIEKYVKRETSYEIIVRLEDGTSRVFHEPTSSMWRSGDRVKIIDGALRKNS
jgi:outer membrane lipoprotein SlyB